MGMSERDPRRDPKVGDVLAKNGKDRKVTEIIGPIHKGYSVRMRVEYVGTGVSSPDVTLRSWRSWAKDAEVTSRAD